jgi:hypothetical protein
MNLDHDAKFGNLKNSYNLLQIQYTYVPKNQLFQLMKPWYLCPKATLKNLCTPFDLKIYAIHKIH